MNPGEPSDPVPADEVLASVRARVAAARHGRLKIFFGATPGVGKTYAMLAASRRAVERGEEVVVGIVETHGRRETARLLDGLEVLPRRVASHRGASFEEFDPAAALSRRPAILLVDELAHTNVGDPRHPKRWQDVLELLEAGITVWTTLNVQHVESLNDVVAQITGIRVRETVPDALLERADEIELVDLPPDALTARLREGKVYLGEQAARAEAGFFRRGNLLALRELALRQTAQHVEEDVREYRQDLGIEATWPAAEHVLACVSPSPFSKAIVRAAARLARSLRARFSVVHVDVLGRRVGERDRLRLADHLRLAERFGAELVTLTGDDPADAILDHARRQNATRIVLGKPTHARLLDLATGSLLDRVVRGSGDIDVLVVAGEPEEGQRTKRRRSPVPRSGVAAYVLTTLAVALTTALCAALFDSVGPANLVMVYLLAIVLVALRFGRGPAVLASVLSVAGFDFFFVPPYYTFAVADVKYVITFAVMLTVGILVSTLAATTRRQVEAAAARERRTAALLSLARELAVCADFAAIADVATRHLGAAFDSDVAFYRASPSRTLELAPAPEGSRSFRPDERDHSVAAWVFDLEHPAGIGTETLPGSRALFLPLVSTARALGVLALLPAERANLEDRAAQQLLDAFVNLIATAWARAEYQEEAHSTRLRVQHEELRSALLSSVSHDLRTPLAAITGSASSLLEEPGPSAPERRELLETILDESERLHRLIRNLLDVTRLESGGLQLNRGWTSIEEIVGCALDRSKRLLEQREVKLDLPAELPLVHVDALLVEQAFINLIENAVKYSPDGTSIEIGARVDGARLVVEVRDHGRGIEPGLEQRIFDRFVRGAQDGRGIGLGLAIARGIVVAHGGAIAAANAEGGGAVFRVSLPIEAAPAMVQESVAAPSGEGARE
jgi:two-component system sensor histidine kinase KdpD